MNKQIASLCIVLIGVGFLITTLLPQSKAQNPNKMPVMSVWIGFRATMSAVFITNSYGIFRPQTGMEVEWVSASTGAPAVPVGYPGAETIAYYLGQGFTMHYHPNHSTTMTWLSQDKVLFTRP